MSRDRSRRSPSRDVSRRYADDHGAAAPAASSQRPRSSAGRPASRTPGRESPSHYSDLRHMLEQRRKVIYELKQENIGFVWLHCSPKGTAACLPYVPSVT